MYCQSFVTNTKNDAASLQNKLSQIRPPHEFFDIRRMSKPADFGEVQQRVSYNLGYYQPNYICIVALLGIYSLVTNPLLLFVLALSVMGVLGIGKLNGQDLELGFARLTTSQLYTGLLVVVVPLGFLASPISAMLWLLGASMVTVMSHAAFMEKPIETVFEEEV